MVRIQILLGEQEREEFRRLAKRHGMSLSAWLREAGREKAAAGESEQQIDSKQALRDFFAECDLREQGREPDWEEHREVIDRSKRSGAGEN
jgi:hypothetical protein